MMFKMVMIVYNEALNEEVRDALADAGLKNYTKTTGAFGRGTHSGTHEGTDIWPGRNSILYVVCDEKESVELMERVRSLREKLANEGIKAFILPVDEIT